MTSYLNLDLNAVTIDAELAHQLPYALSNYYLALPLARENGRVSVAMAYPENQAARQSLGRLLQADIVPVQASVDAIRSALTNLYQPEQQQVDKLFVWHDQSPLATSVMDTARTLNKTLHAQMHALVAPQTHLSVALTLAAAEKDTLVVLHMPETISLSTILSRAATPLFLVRDDYQPIHRILVALRGFASDEYALRSIVRFAWPLHTTVTLMPLVYEPVLNLSHFQRQGDPFSQHLERCLHHLHENGMRVDLKFRQGDPIRQVIAEVSTEPYDLLVIAAEARGAFVGQMIMAMNQCSVYMDRPIFIVKPPYPSSQSPTFQIEPS